MKMMKRSMTTGMGAMLLLVMGCMHKHPAMKSAATQPEAQWVSPPATEPVATADLGQVSRIPGLAKKPKPFIKVPNSVKIPGAAPSTLLLEHASDDSPIPLSEYANQPVYRIADFHLRSDLSAADLEKRLGPPAQWADNEDPWFVYRIVLHQELWLHFASPDHARLLAADLVRHDEDGYVRTRVFEAPASH
jgi:hypothetical protein